MPEHPTLRRVVTNRPLGFAASVVLATVLSACGEAKDERGLNYFPDMYYSPALKSQEAFVYHERQVNDAGEVTITAHQIPAMRPAPEGTIPRNFSPYDLPDTPAGLELSRQLHNPLSPTAEVLIEGREKFDIYCAVCHGRSGGVDDNYVGDKVMGIAAINIEAVYQKPDGELYHYLTHGKGKMPDYSAQLLPEQRWAVIHYLRALQIASISEGADKQRLESLEREAEERFGKPQEAIPEYELERSLRGGRREGLHE